jgi:hypothetical protein
VNVRLHIYIRGPSKSGHLVPEGENEEPAEEDGMQSESGVKSLQADNADHQQGIQRSHQQAASAGKPAERHPDVHNWSQFQKIWVNKIANDGMQSAVKASGDKLIGESKVHREQRGEKGPS